MRVSVILPCYEAGPWIGEGLASVGAQTAPPHEVIVINDASTDDSIRRVQASGVPVRLLNVNVHNAARARNAGIEAATGDWIAFLDADDAWYPDHLKNAAILLESSGDVAYMANHHFVFGEGSVARLPESLRPKIDETRSGLSHLCFVSLLTQGFHFGHSTVLLRLDRVREVGSFDVTQKRRHDVDLWLRVIRDRTWAWGAIPAARYRIDTPESISKSVVNCQYYFLRALLKNREGFPGPAMHQLIETAAQRSMSLAFLDGDGNDYRCARELAWPHLKPAYRLCYRVASVCPPLLRWAIRLKRRPRLPRGTDSSRSWPWLDKSNEIPWMILAADLLAQAAARALN